MNREHVAVGLARYSDMAFTSCIVVLVLALVMLAVELAYHRSRKVSQRELQPAAVAADSAKPGVVVDAPMRPFDERAGRSGLALVHVGIALLFACIALRGWATLRPP